MKIRTRGGIARSFVAAGAVAVAVALALPLGAARAQDKTYEMKISTPTINDIPDTYARNFLAAVEKDSGGRINGQVYPASQLGSIPRQIEGTQFGSIQCEVVPPEFMSGLDDRFGVMAAPGLVDSQQHGQRVAADPAVLKLMLSLGADKGLHGAALFMAETSIVVTRNPIRSLADFKGKKLRIFASKFQSTGLERLGVTPVAMSLGDVVPAIQQGAIDGAITGMGPVAHMHFVDAAKFVTMTNQPAIFIIVEINKKWFEFSAQGFATNRRQGRYGAVGRHQSDSGRYPQAVGRKLYRQRRRGDQAAARSASVADEDACQRRRGCVEIQPAACRRL